MLQQRLTRNLYTGQTEPLTAPLSFDFTEDLGDKRSLSLLSQYGGAAAAYSLRALGSYNEHVVRVRRESDNNEKDFTALQVSRGEMVNWVNEQITPPLDLRELTATGRDGPIIEAAAAYSLRNLSDSYTGSVVEVRRSSDNAVQSFTAAEVADGTLVTWVLGDAASLVGDAQYFNGTDTQVSGTIAFNSSTDAYIEVDAYIPDATPSSNQRIFSQGSSVSGNNLAVVLTTSSNITFIVGEDGGGQQSFVSTATITEGMHKIRATLSGGNLVTILVDGVAFDSGSITSTTIGTGSYAFSIGRQTVSTQAFFNGILSGIDINNQAAYTGLGNDPWVDTIGTNNGTPSNLVTFTGQGFDGTVSKWYDQSTTSGVPNANHAVQTDAAKQPKIVDGGSLVTGGIDFDGVNDYLITAQSGQFSQPVSLFQVFSSDALSSGDYQIDAISNSAMLTGGDGSIYYFSGSLLNTNIDFPTSGDTLHSVVFNGSSSTVFADGSSVATGNLGNGNFQKTFSIGARRSGTQASNVAYKEIIIYPSDQTDNRTALEANIGEVYGISGIPAYEDTVNGFVETWYDQSGNGNDATQSVAGSQPKIVDAGVYLGEVDFLDGTNTFLQTNNSDLCNVSELSVFSVLKPYIAQSQAVAFSCGSVVINSTGYGGWRLNLNGYLNIAQFQTQAVGNASVTSLNNSVDGNDNLLSFVANFPDAAAFANGQAGSSTSSAISPNNSDVVKRRFRIGCQYTFQVANFYPEPIKEIILYTSDQSANRLAIEGNINDHYSIYA